VGRVVRVFLSPGDLARGLREKPAWGLALLLGGVVAAVSVALIPEEVWLQMMREQAAAQGRPLPEGFGTAGALFRVTSVVGAMLGWVIWAFLLSGIVTLAFAFVLGDEGRYRQYLAVVSHALLISALGALLTVPLKIAQSDPTLTLSLGTFAMFLQEGYLYRVLRLLDLFGLWGYGVMAVGVSQIDPRRGVGSALVFFGGFAFVVAFLFGLFPG
jgi:hypothetical protein